MAVFISSTLSQDAILDVVTSGQIAWDGLQQRVGEPFKSLGAKCLVFGNGDDDVDVSTVIDPLGQPTRFS